MSYSNQFPRKQDKPKLPINQKAAMIVNLIKEQRPELYKIMKYGNTKQVK